MSRIILHIGVHKTGTSTIQRATTSVQDALAKAGVNYVRNGRMQAWPFAHHDLVRAIIFGDEKVISSVMTEIESSPDQIHLISCEDFSGIPFYDKVQLLADLFRDHEVQVVMIVRKPSSFMRSWFREDLMRLRSILPFNEFVRKNAGRVEFRTLYDLWKDYFQKENVFIETYEHMRADNLYESFMSFLNLPVIKGYDQTVYNVSQPDRLIEFIVNTGKILKLNELDNERKEWVSKSLYKLGVHVHKKPVEELFTCDEGLLENMDAAYEQFTTEVVNGR